MPDSHRLLLLLALTCALTSSALGAEVVPVPAFDHGAIKASYVVSLPNKSGSGGPHPLILDFHGAIAPNKLGANITRERLWAKFAKQAKCIVVGLNGRTRSWGTIRGEKNDPAFALHVLAEARKRYKIDPKRIYLAGFSSGSDFLCKGDLQTRGPFAASLVVCPGPPNVVGLKDGSLLRKKGHPFYFLAGEEDYVRKAGAFEAFLALDRAGGRARYFEAPGVAHAFPAVEVYARIFGELEQLAATPRAAKPRAAPSAAEEKRGRALLAEAEGIDGKVEPGRAYETWWRLRTGYFRIPELADRAVKEMQTLESAGRRELFRSRRDYFRTRKHVRNTGKKRRSAKSAHSANGLWTFDRYLTYPELTAHLQDLAKRFPGKVRLHSMGRSIEGRELWVLEITDRAAGPADEKPAVYVQGCLHGNEISSMMNVLCFAHELAANPDSRRGIERRLASTTFYAAPAVNPDAAHHYLTEPHCHWRPRFNYRPHDRDGDGRVDEDGYEDLDGDGEIGFMYRSDPEGAYVLLDGRLVRRPAAEGRPRYALVAREGVDNDGDGEFSEDRPGGVDLNRNFPVGFKAGKAWEGTRGAGPLSEPETKAITGFIEKHPHIAMFVDYHNAASCVFYWLGPEPNAGDVALYDASMARAKKTLGYVPRPLRHAGAGISAAWAHGQRGILAFIVELEATLGPTEAYYRKAWQDDAFITPKPFNHPQLGEVLIGNDWKKIAKRNPHPSDILWQADRNWKWLAREMDDLARLALEDPFITATQDGYEITGTVVNKGARPTDLAAARSAGTARPVEIVAEGAEVEGETTLGRLAAGERKSFRVRLKTTADRVTLLVRHPRAGSVRLPVTRERTKSIAVRHDYPIEPSFATPDRAKRANNAFYRNGVSDEERGPAFKLTHRSDRLNVAVVLGEWADRRHTVPASAFEAMFFSGGTYHDRSPTGQPVHGSVRDFYREMSYGRLEVTGRVFDWAELPGGYEKYRSAGFGSPIVQQSLIAAVKERHGADVLDGFNGIAFIWAGNNVRRTSALWPMKLTLKDRPGVAAFKMAERHHGEAVPIGVACHELGHTFGVADKYGLGATRNPLGPWCLMGKGTHGGTPSGRHRPFHLCAWCKSVIGWVKPVVIDPAVPQKLALRPILFGPGECYRILLQPDGSEYLLLENRRAEGFFTDLPSAGLVILRVGPNDAPAYPQTRVQMLPAHGQPPRRRGVVANPEAVAWPQPGRTEFAHGNVRLTGIRRADDVIYFEVAPRR